MDRWIDILTDREKDRSTDGLIIEKLLFRKPYCEELLPCVTGQKKSTKT